MPSRAAASAARATAARAQEKSASWFLSSFVTGATHRSAARPESRGRAGSPANRPADPVRRATAPRCRPVAAKTSGCNDVPIAYATSCSCRSRPLCWPRRRPGRADRRRRPQSEQQRLLRYTQPRRRSSARSPRTPAATPPEPAASSPVSPTSPTPAAAPSTAAARRPAPSRAWPPTTSPTATRSASSRAEAAGTIGQLRFGLDINKAVAKPPFVTNGTGLVKNLNADRVDGKSAEEFAEKGSLELCREGQPAVRGGRRDGTIGANRGVPANTQAQTATDDGDPRSSPCRSPAT